MNDNKPNPTIFTANLRTSRAKAFREAVKKHEGQVLTLPKDIEMKIVQPRITKPTAAELYAKVRRAAKRIPVAINVLRQIDAGQKMRHREVRFRDEALTFLANNFSPDTATAETIKEAMSIVETTTRKLRTLPNGDRRTRRFASRELDRAIRLSQRPAKTEYNLPT